eukprot:1159699-Pelagomonas_calceolata.AAC.14
MGMERVARSGQVPPFVELKAGATGRDAATHHLLWVATCANAPIGHAIPSCDRVLWVVDIAQRTRALPTAVLTASKEMCEARVDL